MTSQSFCSDSHCYFFQCIASRSTLVLFLPVSVRFSSFACSSLIVCPQLSFSLLLMCTFPEIWLLPDEPQQGRFVFPTLLSGSVNYSKPCLVLNTAWYTALWLILQPQVHSLFLAKSSRETLLQPSGALTVFAFSL